MQDLPVLIQSHASEIITLEEEELENGPVTQPTVYSKLLALYLIENDLRSALLLWKRIPQLKKDSEPEIVGLWDVGQKLWHKNIPGAYQAMQQRQWSPDIMPLIDELRLSIRERSLHLVAKAYSSIKASNLASLTNLTLDEAVQAGLARGWVYEQEGQLLIVPNHGIEGEHGDNEKNGNEIEASQLAKLTDFLSFLEN